MPLYESMYYMAGLHAWLCSMYLLAPLYIGLCEVRVYHCLGEARGGLGGQGALDPLPRPSPAPTHSNTPVIMWIANSIPNVFIEFPKLSFLMNNTYFASCSSMF